MALPGDISPPPAPGDTPRPALGDSTSQPGEKAGSLPGLPRLFFAAEPDQQAEPDARTTSYGQPGGPGLQAFGQPGAFGQPPGPQQPRQLGQPPPPQQPPQFGQPGGLGQPGRVDRPGQRTPARAARPRPTRPPDRELRQRAIAALLLGVISLVALLGLGGDLHRGVYLLVFSAAIGIAACVIGITAVLKARKTGSYRPRGAVGGMVLGTLAALLSIPILATYLAFPHQVDNYVKCLTQSNSQSSGNQQACMDKFYKSIHLGAPAPGNAVVRISTASGERRRPA